MRVVSVAAVVLAAGASRRLGRPKQTVRLGGEMLVERAVRVAREAGLAPVFAVVNSCAAFIPELEQQGCVIIVNPEADEGMAASVRLGVSTAQMAGAAGVVVMACDQVAVTPELLRELVAQPGVVTGSAYAGRIGVPAYFPAAAFGTLLELSGDKGAREVLREARSVPAEEMSLDIDTEEDLERARMRYEGLRTEKM